MPVTVSTISRSQTDSLIGAICSTLGVLVSVLKTSQERCAIKVLEMEMYESNYDEIIVRFVCMKRLSVLVILHFAPLV